MLIRTTKKKTLVRPQLDPEDFVRKALKNGRYVLDMETYGLQPLEGKPKGWACKSGDDTAWYGVGKFGDYELRKLIRIFQPLFSARDVEWINFHNKFDWKWLVHNGAVIRNLIRDAMQASYALNEDRKYLQLGDGQKAQKYGLKKLVWEHFGIRMSLYKDTKEEGNLFGRPLGEYARDDVTYTEQLWDFYLPQLHDDDLWDVFERIDMPLVPVLADMELTGILIDHERMADLEKRYYEKQVKLEKLIWKAAGYRFDIGKTHEVERLLFGHGVPNLEGKRKKIPLDDDENPVPIGKSGRPSTTKKVLEYFAPDFPIVQQILDWRHWGQLINTFTRGLQEKARNSSDGRVRCSFNQTGTKIGRLSSSDPNMQNIPRPDKDDDDPDWKNNSIRGAIISAVGKSIADADLSQIELRVMGHLSGEKKFLECYRSMGVCPTMCADYKKSDPKEPRCAHTDIHTRTANDTGVPRNPTAKNLNFGCQYRIGPRKARGYIKAKTVAEAADFIKRWFDAFPGVRLYHKDVEKFLPNNGWVMQTITGRKRRLLKDAKLNDFRAVTQGVQFAVSGSSQDLIKMAMIAWWEKRQELADAGDERWAESHPILQVHDEFAVECPDEVAEDNLKLIQDSMNNADKGQLLVPIQSSGGCGKRWSEAH